jgi:hypothetical protein
MCRWFDVAGALGPEERATVAVGVTVPGSNGDNFGYKSVLHGTLIEINSFEGAGDQVLADDFARSVFVAELAEVLMGARNSHLGHTAWDAGDSAGEALSTVCQEMLYSDACYRTAGQGWPRAQFWLATPDWPDWVSRTDGTDQNFVTFGCAILFIAFLIGQLGFTLEQVIQADGVTLEEKFVALTGRHGGFAEMTGVLSQFFNTGVMGELRSDFPFPLLPPSARSVAIWARQERGPGRVAVGGGMTDLPLPFPCRGTVEAQYTITDVSCHIHLTAMPRGFATPQYAWTLPTATGPVAIPPEGFNGTVQLTVASTDPANPSVPPIVSTRDAQVYASAPNTTPYGQAQYVLGEIDLFVSGAEGEVICTVSCEVTDTVSPGSTEATTLLTASTRETRYDEEARSEIDSCRERGVELLTREFKPNLLRQIMPDPPLDLLHAITTIRALASQLTVA